MHSRHEAIPSVQLKRPLTCSHERGSTELAEVQFVDVPMQMWIQNLIVFILVGACCAFIATQIYRSLKGKRSKLGSCCAKGCSETHADQTAQSKPERVVFFPSDMLTASRRSNKS